MTEPDNEPGTTDISINLNDIYHQLRLVRDELSKDPTIRSREISLCITKLQEAEFWLNERIYQPNISSRRSTR